MRNWEACSPWGTTRATGDATVKFPLANLMPKRFRNLIGPKVREFRERLGLTQDDLAARLQLVGLENFDRVVVAKIESQIRSVYDFEAIILARVLKEEVAKLMDIPHAALKQAAAEPAGGARIGMISLRDPQPLGPLDQMPDRTESWCTGRC